MKESRPYHPRIAVTRTFGRKTYHVDSCGAYHFLVELGDECAKALGLPDFSSDEVKDTEVLELIYSIDEKAFPPFWKEIGLPGSSV